MARKKTLPLIEDFNDIPEEALVPEAEQPYRIPDHWKWVRFSSLNSYQPHSIDPKKNPNSEFILYSVPTFPTGEPEILTGEKIGSTKQLITAGDVLLCKINPRINRVWIVSNPPNGNLIASSEWIVFRPVFGIASYYQTYFSSAYFRQKLLSQVSGVGGSLTRARPKLVDNYPIPLPPLDEQQQIVEKLSGRLQKVDEVTGLLEKFLEDSASRTESLLEAALQGHLTKDWRSTNNQQRDNWVSMTLGEAFQWSSGGTPSRKNPDYYTGKIPWIKSGELPDGSIESSEEYITETAVENSSTKVFPAGSVAIAMYGATIGRVGILGVEAATNQAIAVAKNAEHTVPRFLFFYLRANRNKFINLAKGGAQPNISQQIIKAFPYKIPSIAEQEEILRLIDLNINTLSNTESLVKTVLSDLSDARQSLISAALAGRATSPPSM